MKKLSTKQRSGNESVVWLCCNSKCRKKMSIRSHCSFLAFKRVDGRLRSSITLCKILHLLYLYLGSYSTCRQLKIMTGLGLPTIVDWTNLIREVCSNAIVQADKLVGTNDSPIQIDESYFRGKTLVDLQDLIGAITMDLECWVHGCLASTSRPQ